ncbi:MAG: MFS transporter [Pseudomonadota bacterium]
MKPSGRLGGSLQLPRTPGSTLPSSPSSVQPVKPTPLFAIPDYRRGWFYGMLTGVARWLEFLALGIFAYQLTESPPLVALLGILRLVPYFTLGYLVGSVTDKIDRKLWLLIALVAMCAISGTMAYLAATGEATYTTIVIATLATGVFWLTDMPFRRRFMLDAVGSDRAGRAMGFDNITNYATRGLGPLIGGVVFQFFGPVGVFGVNLGVYVLCFIVALGFQRQRPAKAVPEVASEPKEPNARPTLQGSLLSDARFCIILAVTVLYNLFCIPFVAMLPVFAQKDFGLQPAAVGTLAAFEGVGGFVGSIVVGLLIRPPAFFIVYFCGPLIYLCAVLTLSFALTPGFTLVALIVLSFGGACFSATQYTLIYTTAAPELRGRAFGFLSMAIGCGTLGLWNAGYLFNTFPSATAMQIMALEGLVPMLLLALYAAIRR